MNSQPPNKPDDPSRDAMRRQEKMARQKGPRKATDAVGEVVDEASEESFPASDPPAWTETTASKDSKE